MTTQVPPGPENAVAPQEYPQFAAGYAQYPPSRELHAPPPTPAPRTGSQPSPRPTDDYPAVSHPLGGATSHPVRPHPPGGAAGHPAPTYPLNKAASHPVPSHSQAGVAGQPVPTHPHNRAADYPSPPEPQGGATSFPQQKDTDHSAVSNPWQEARSSLTSHPEQSSIYYSSTTNTQPTNAGHPTTSYPQPGTASYPAVSYPQQGSAGYPMPVAYPQPGAYPPPAAYPTAPPWATAPPAAQSTAPPRPAAPRSVSAAGPGAVPAQFGGLLVRYPDEMRHASRAQAPAVWPVAVYALLFTVLGAVSAQRRADQARRTRNSTAPYWIAFLVSAAVGAFCWFVLAVVVGAPALTEIQEANRLEAVQRNVVGDGQLREARITVTAARCRAVSERDAEGMRDYLCRLTFQDGKTGTLALTADESGRWHSVTAG